MNRESLPPGPCCILHFGMPKTGSSSIQASLYRAPSMPGVRYVHAGTSNASGALATAFMRDPGQHHANRKRGLEADELKLRREQVLAQLDEALAPGAHRYVISAEMLSNLDLEELSSLADWIRQRVPQVVAVGYVRAPKAFMESAFQQKVKSGGRRMNLGALYPSYQERFEKFETVFGRDQVRYWLFDPATFSGQDVVQDFCQRLDIPLPASSIYRMNEAISRDALALLYAYRRFGPGYGSGMGVLEENARLIRSISGLRGPKVRFAADVVAAELAEHRDDIAWMEERLGSSLDERPTADENAIREEAELLNFSEHSLQWLADQLDDPGVRARCQQAVEPTEVADWVHRLRIELQPPSAKRRTGRAAVGPAENAEPALPTRQERRRSSTTETSLSVKSLVDRLVGESHGVGMDEQQLQLMVERVLRLLQESIDQTDEGALVVPGLGKFKVNIIDGSPGTGRSRRVAFRSAAE